MATKIGINGFGRIGRQVLKAVNEFHKDELEVVAINDLVPTETNAHLLKYDSNFGRYDGTVEVVDGGIKVDGKMIKISAERDPGNIKWGEMGVDIVIESTGVFRDAATTPGPGSHITAGAKKVIISAPAKNEDITVVIGVNDDKLDVAKHNIISNASCTTNCLAPVAKVIYDNLGIVKGLMVTVHSYTGDQRILDIGHSDPRRARAAALNIIPTTTGAAKAVSLVIPELKGKMDGYSLRVPTPTVSVVDVTMEVEKSTTAEEVNAMLKAAAEGPMKGILGFESELLVSMDFKGDSRSSIVDAALTSVIGGNMVKVVSWYDNEWGYSVRTSDLAALIAKSL
ncbi:MAG: type I glyceraldehyde-3-phosphate dehydrogenase [Anaerolineales bacterium]|nr:type I glyceraldehyde-3-phosphate dehydrogenase [Anaerolineales bacterium]